MLVTASDARLADCAVDSSGTVYGTSNGSGNTATFSLSTPSPTFGLHTFKVRATEVDTATGNLLVGDWEDLPVTITAPPNDPPRIVGDVLFSQYSVASEVGGSFSTGL